MSFKLNNSLHIGVGCVHVASSQPFCVTYKKPRAGAESELTKAYSLPAW